MRSILPGRPQPKLQAVTAGVWEGHQIIAYISGDALVILGGPNRVLQTIYIEEDQALQAVSFDETTGKIAVCAGVNVYVYQPYGQDEGEVKWSLQCHLKLKDPKDASTTLSWGSGEELLVGSSSLTLFATHGTNPEEVWARELANPVKFAQFSHDAAMIASTGKYDRLLKIWHRLAFGSVDQRFDYAYLPHPTVITAIHWRKPFHREQTLDTVLYTVCADNKVRIWVTAEIHSLQIMNLWGEIDLMESIQPRSIAEQSHKRYAFIIDSRDFTLATERAVQLSSDKAPDDHALEHIITVANRNPEVCMVLDDRGHMSAWGLESVGCKARKTSDIFNIAHVEGLKFHFAKNPADQEDNVQFLNFCGGAPGTPLTILAHHFDGRLEWLETRIDVLFDPSPREDRVERKAVWTGHSSPIKKVNRTAKGRALVSRSISDETIVWTQRVSQGGVTLHRHSIVNVSDHIHRTWLLHEGDFVVFLHYGSVSLWDARGPIAVEAARCQYEVRGKPLCLLVLPETNEDTGCVHIATITSEMKGVAWEIRLPPPWTDASTRRFSALGPMQRRPSRLSMDSVTAISMTEFCRFDLGFEDGLSFVLPVDPAGTAPVISGFLDTFARDIAISYTTSGVLTCWTARVDTKKRKLDWLVTSKVETSIENPSLASGTSIRKAALVDADRTLLTIWNTRGAQLEHEERFDKNGFIQDLDWSSTPDNQSILAVGFPHRVVVYAQLRYDYLDAGPSWAPIREFRTRDITPHPIGDSVWLSNGHLVIGAGNQLFVQDENVDVSDSLLPDLRLISRQKAHVDVFTLVSRLNGPLPVFHPQFLAQCLLAGKVLLVHRILINLYKNLKFWTDGDELDSFLGLTPDDFSRDGEMSMSSSRKEMHSSYADFTDDIDPTTVTEEVATSLNEKLTGCQIPQLSSREQFHLADIIECVGTMEKHRRSIDLNASRFLVFFRQHMLRNSQHTPEQVPISWREIIWAYFSDSQDILVDLVSRHFQGKMIWEHARQSGLFMWMTDINALRAQFEVIARNEYTKAEDKNPVDCSLYYLALRKKAVLVGLWRMATWSREQGATQRLLANNFQEPRWKTAALKNAYALMGKRRFEYAAAFFLLADHLSDAVSVLSNQLGDMQLAIAVARVYEGDEGPVLRQFLREKVLAHAVKEGNRWLATWVFWMLSRRDRAVRSLATPLSTLLSPPETPNLQSLLFLSDDPALVVLYKQLREKSLQTLRGAVMISPRTEWEFVIHTAELYERMGCDLLALDLVRTWEFLTPPPAPPKPVPFSPVTPATPRSPFRFQNLPQSALDALELELDPRKILRRRSSLVVADLPTRETLQKALHLANEGSVEDEDEHEEAHKKDATSEQKKPPPTQFQEPDANSLLDAFGF